MSAAKNKKDISEPSGLADRCPMEEVTIFGKFYYTWVSPFLWRAVELSRAGHQIDEREVYQNPPGLEPGQLADDFERAYEKGGFRAALIEIMRWPIIMATFVQAASASLLVLLPLIIGELLKVVKAGWQGDWLGTGKLFAITALCLLLKSILENANIFITFKGANKFQLGMIAAIQRKALRLSAASRQKFGGGVGINLIGVDPLRIFNALGVLPYVLVCPFHIGLACAVLSCYVGWSVLAGLVCIIAFLPFQYVIVKYSSRFRKQLNRLSDERLKLTQETLQGIRLLKYFAWEPVFLKRIEQIRKAELGRIRLMLFLQAISHGLVFWLPVFGGSAIVALHAFRQGSVQIEGDLVYTIIIMMNYLGTPIYILPVFATATVAAKAAVRRLDEYFQASEAPSHLVMEEAEKSIIAEDVQFMWETLPPSELGSRKKKKKSAKKSTTNQTTTTTTTLFTTDRGDLYAQLRLSLSIDRGQFVVVLGEVGSGKSSLLSALIGEMKLESGSCTINAPQGLAYCPQQAWIMSGSIRENILFGRDFDAALYARVLDESCLESDVKMFPEGDLTVLGEGGAGLSGGQKQRLSLARALYAKASLYLLDDPLSAVDPAVARRILHGSLLAGPSGLLHGTTRILVTHQIGLIKELGNSVDRLIVMKDMAISYNGPFSMSQVDRTAKAEEAKEAAEEAVKSQKESLMVSSDPSLATTPVPEAASVAEAINEEEKPSVANGKGVLPSQSGDNKFWIYFSAAGLFWSIFVVGSLLTATELLKVYKDQYLNGITSKVDAALGGLKIYTWLGLAQGALSCTTGIVYGCIVSFRASSHIHREALGSLLKTTMGFFDQVQLGALLERFGSDMMSVDTVLPEKALQVLAVVGSVCTSIVALAWSCWMTGSDSPASIPSLQAFGLLLLFILPAIAFIIGCWYVFTHGWSPIQQIIGKAAGRVTGVFSESMTGLPTLRSFRAGRMFSDTSAARIESLGRSVLLALAMRRWVSVRIDIAATALVLFSAAFCLLLGFPPKTAGLLMYYCLTTAYLLEWCIKQFAEVESNLNAFDRIAALRSVLKDEASTPSSDSKTVTIPTEPDTAWPREGTVKIDSLFLRYRPELPATLKGLSLDIKAGEKVAIVGRTGAGKSSLIAALYRMAHTPDSGSILIDGVDIATVPLPVLRKRLSIVTQDPILFSGTLRFNMDPEGIHTDADIWRVLEACRMQKDVSAHPAKLEMPVEEGGSNFSIGQRQLLCLARALLRNPAPLLLIDEATANVDFETDARIQAALRQHLHDRPGTTMITVAHRIATVMDYDKVAVLGNGQLLEWGSPAELLQKPNGHFRLMASKANINGNQ